MCHVFTVFTFTPSAKHAYRSIASFVRNVLKVPGADPFQDLFKPAANESSNSKSELEGKGPAKEKCILNDDVVEESRGLYSGIQITENLVGLKLRFQIANRLRLRIEIDLGIKKSIFRLSRFSLPGL